tara:strand:- start:295 stop:960 length:666 start_codon:yes stop_codon:yes gene_type:complete
MPNWCFNNLSVNATNNNKTLEFLNKLYEEANKGKLNEFIIPFSDMGLEEWDYGSCIEYWGTKWDIDLIASDISIEENNINVEISFNTAWGPNIPVMEKLYEKLSKLDSNCSVRSSYDEPGMNFYGIFEDGNDDCREMGPLYSISSGWLEEIEVKESDSNLVVASGDSNLFFIIKERKKYDDHDLMEDWKAEVEEFVCFSNAEEEISLYKVEGVYYINSHYL